MTEVTAATKAITPMPDTQTQLDKFKQAARELETDDDEARFDERVKNLVKHKSVPEKPE